MDGEIAAILAMDGIASGAIYVLIGLGLVLIFAVTRVIFVPFGDIAAFTALSLASLENGVRPGTIGLVVRPHSRLGTEMIGVRDAREVAAMIAC